MTTDTTPAPVHYCHFWVEDGGEARICMRTDTREHILGLWVCPEHDPRRIQPVPMPEA